MDKRLSNNHVQVVGGEEPPQPSTVHFVQPPDLVDRGVDVNGVAGVVSSGDGDSVPASSAPPGGVSSQQLSHLPAEFSAQIINLSYEPIFVWTVEEGIVEWNKGSEQLYGYSEEDAIGRDVHELLKTVHSLPPASILGRLTESGEWTAELRHTAKDGREVIVESRQQVLAVDGRRFVVETNRDITERKRSDETLRYQLALTQAITDNAQSGLMMTDLDGTITFANPAAERITGYSAGELIGRNWHAAMHNKHPDGTPIPAEECDFMKALLSAAPVVDSEVHFVHKDGHFYPVRRSARPISKGGRPVGIVAEIQDITTEKRIDAERQEILKREKSARLDAEAANRAKDEFLAVLSHELRTPLHSIKGWISILQAGAVDEAGVKHGLEVIARNVNAQNALIEDILDVSRIVVGKLGLETSTVSLAAIVRNVVDEVCMTAETNGITLTAEIDETAGEMEGDALRLRQIVNNLLNNALKFTPAGGSIAVSLTRCGDKACISVTDSGVGVSPELLSRIFDRFQQADSTSRRSHSGLGLGLAIAKHLVELHGGTISASSGGVGKGSTFTIGLPLAASPSGDRGPAAGTSVSVAAGDSALAGIKLLLVDDDEDALQMLSLVLSRRGANVECMNLAEAAAERLCSERFDVLISDLGMATMDGYDLIHRLREEMKIPASEMPAIALSGYAGAEDRAHCLASGFQMHVSKPVDIPALIEAIRLLNHGRIAGGN
ncbi:MAG TPA: PAS domain S-box protein [Pyrinomonadaceae bacterium]|nr:PAS domain S-box protein [Pyrinomonadaceae bacterium]